MLRVDAEALRVLVQPIPAHPTLRTQLDSKITGRMNRTVPLMRPGKRETSRLDVPMVVSATLGPPFPPREYRIYRVEKVVAITIIQ